MTSFSFLLQNGELIYGCKDNEDALSDLNELACHLKPFFFPSNGLVNGTHCTRTVLKELIHVITMALLSSTDACKAGDMKTVPSSQGRSFCEASAFSKEIARNGKQFLSFICPSRIQMIKYCTARYALLSVWLPLG